MKKMHTENRKVSCGLGVRLVLFFLLGMATCSCGSKNTPTQRIEAALEYDRQAAEESSSKMRSKNDVNGQIDELAKGERTYAAKMMSYVNSNTDLPADFRGLLFDHISAHQRFANVLESHPYLPNDFVEGVGLGMLNCLLGKLDGGAGEIVLFSDQVEAAESDVSDTWDNVRRCAIQYGAKLPPEE